MGSGSVEADWLLMDENWFNSENVNCRPLSRLAGLEQAEYY